MDPTNQNRVSSSQNKKLIIVATIVVFLILLLAIYSIVAKNKNSSAPPASTSTNQQLPNDSNDAEKTASLFTEPAEIKVEGDQPISFSVWLDTGGQQVSAVKAIIEYPADQYDFIGIDEQGSALELGVEAKGGEGRISIARGQIGGVSGKQLVAKVNLRTKTNDGTGKLTFSDESQALTLSDNPQNILNKTSGASLTIGQ